MVANTETGTDDVLYARRLLRTVITVVITFSSSMTIVSASLPTMADDLDSSEALLAWGVTGLFLVMAVGTPTLGRLGDIHGHRRVFLTGSVVLVAGTALCGLAPTAETFVAARMVVGAGIAATMPNGMALIMAAWPHERRSEAMGWYQMAMTGAPVMGLVIGGPLIDAFGWRIVFAVLAPLGAAGTVVAARVIRPDGPGVRVPIDVAGAVSLGSATLAFLLGLERTRAASLTDPLAVGLWVVTVVTLIVFVRIEHRTPAPLLKLGYFRRPDFTGTLIAQPLTQFAYMGAFLISPLLLDDVFGYSVSAIALVLLFRPLSYSLSSPLGGRLAGRFGVRPLILSGSVLMTAGALSFAWGASVESVPVFVVGLILSGLAMGFASPAYVTALANAVDPGDLGIANGMGTTMMNIGMLTGIQTSFVILGDGREPGDFAMVFLVTAVVAAASTCGALMVTARDAERPG